MQLLTVSFYRETDCSFKATLPPHMSLAMSMAADFTSLSPIVCDFISLPLRSETTYDASVACLEAKSAGFVSKLILLRIIIPFLGAEKRCDSFSYVTGASFPNVSSIYFSSAIRWIALYNTVHIAALFSTMIFDRSESQVRKFLLVGIHTHS